MPISSRCCFKSQHRSDSDSLWPWSETEELQFLQVSGRLVERMGGRKSVGRGILEGGMRFTVKGGAA